VFTLKVALSAMREQKCEKSLRLWFKEIHSSELMVVKAEDIACFPGRIEGRLVQVTMTDGNSFWNQNEGQVLTYTTSF